MFSSKCRRSYDGEEHIHFFKMRDDFTDSEKDNWRICLRRADSAYLKHVYLYAKHFYPWEVLYTCEALLPDDWIHVVSFTLCIFYSLSTFDSFPSFVIWLHIVFTKSWFCYWIPFIMSFSFNWYTLDLVLVKAPLLLFYPIVLLIFSKLLLNRLVLTLTRKR